MPTNKDELMRAIVKNMSNEDREKLIEDLGVTHMAFENWANGRSKMVDSKTRNKLMHLIGLKVNYEEFQNMVNDMSECCEEESED